MVSPVAGCCSLRVFLCVLSSDVEISHDLPHASAIFVVCFHLPKGVIVETAL